MRFFLVLFFIVGLGVADLSAAQSGPVKSGYEGFGDGGVSFGYSRLSSDWGTDGAEFKGLELKADQYYLQLNMGLAEDWLGYLRGGLAVLTAQNAFVFSDAEFENGPLPFVSLGFNGAIFKGKSLTIGVNGHGSYLGNYSDEEIGSGADSTGSTVAVEETIDFYDLWQVDGGVTVEGTVEGVALYAGPLFYWAQMRAKETATWFDSIQSAYLSNEIHASDVEESAGVGFVLGARWYMANGFTFDVELKQKSDLNVDLGFSYNY